jgi:hypothetical protein
MGTKRQSMMETFESNEDAVSSSRRLEPLSAREDIAIVVPPGGRGQGNKSDEFPGLMRFSVDARRDCRFRATIAAHSLSYGKK